MKDGRHMLAVADVETGGDTQRYFLPLSAVWDDDASTMTPRMPATMAKLRRTNKVGALMDGASDEDMARSLLDAMREELTIPCEDGQLVFTGKSLPDADTVGEPRLLGAEQSNASIAFSDKIILKLYRRLREGLQPDIEVARYLSEECAFTLTPRLLGTIAWQAADGTETILAAASEFVPNQGDAWAFLTDWLDREMEAREIGHDDQPLPPLVGALDLGTLLGQRTAEMHLALAAGNGAFDTTPMDAESLTALMDETRREMVQTLDALDPATIAGPAAQIAQQVLDQRDAIMARIDRVASLPLSGGLSRVHGDYHLGQVLVAQDDLVIIDFEGEPSRSLEERQAKSSPLRDVAGMLRSFDYALATALDRRTEAGADPERSAAHLDTWRATTAGAFLDSWRATMGAAAVRPDDRAFEDALLELHLLRKCAYEVRYERAFRPDWIDVPLTGLLQIAVSA
jgi:maltose alpha-D-glucosyltransferase / alpha-amylase